MSEGYRQFLSGHQWKVKEEKEEEKSNGDGSSPFPPPSSSYELPTTARQLELLPYSTTFEEEVQLTLIVLEELRGKVGEDHEFLAGVTEELVRENKNVRYAVNNYAQLYFFLRNQNFSFQKQHRDR
mmetsp:Transcript_8854/g.6601  ORF Transcript_8854/g.6601 Transcript_8854/m.6601 type:complete len:126 (+) Transcript_8854:322-699(+)